MSESRDWRKVRAEVKDFVENEVYPAESILNERSEESNQKLKELMGKAKEKNLWALGHPEDIGGQGMPFMEYVYVNEVVGRSSPAMVALGTHSLQDSIMLREFASDRWRDAYLGPLVAGEIFPSFGMTEPDTASGFTDWVYRINCFCRLRVASIFLDSFYLLFIRCLHVRSLF